MANTEIPDDRLQKQFLQLFNQTKVDNPKFPAFSKRMDYLKHEEGGKQRMCTIMEEYAKEYAAEYAKEYAAERVDEAINEKIKTALKKGKKPVDIADFLDVELSSVLEIAKGVAEN